MHPARIAELLQPFLASKSCHSEPASFAGEESAVLSPAQLQAISTYIDILLHWNARMNLTAIRHEEEIVIRHFGESLFAARHLFPKVYPVSSVPPVLKDFDVDVAGARSPKAALRLADLGSGAGFPGIPIKLWAPHVAVTLIESNHKKATFLRQVVRSLALKNIDIQNVRADAIPRSSFDFVIIRAVERLNETLPTAAGLLTPGGRLALLISSTQVESVHAALPNFEWARPLPIPESTSRQLLLNL
jgi:16S rRNA (guanine527-N7)-methyltransferase